MVRSSHWVWTDEREGASLPNRFDKFLFVAGIIVYLMGQTSISLIGAMTKDQIPIDVIHWLMLSGAVMMTPFAARLPRNGVGIIASPVLIIGIVCVIGMCTLDFVFWSLTDNELRSAVVRQLQETAVIWGPFISYGGYIFTTGVALPSLSYFRTAPAGVALVVIGAITILSGPLWTNIPGYGLMGLGYAVIFYWSRRD